MKTFGKLASGLLVAAASGVALIYFFGLIVLQGDEGVRLENGVLTDERIFPGIHLNIPKYYEIRVVQGFIHITPMRFRINKEAGMPSVAVQVPIWWRVVDSRKFYLATRVMPAASDAEVGESAIHAAIEAAMQSTAPEFKDKQRTSPRISIDWVRMAQLANRQLVEQAGIKILQANGIGVGN